MKTFTELTPQERNDLIATGVLGWSINEDLDVYEDEAGTMRYARKKPDIINKCWNPCGDLNACHLVEEKMNASKRELYTVALHEIVNPRKASWFTTRFRAFHATASQKTEAILRAYNLIS